MSKKLFLFLLVIAVTTVVSYGQTNSKVVKAEVKTTLYCDHCSKCESCGIRLQDGLRKLKGFKLFNLDEKKMIFYVFYDSTLLDLITIKTAISNMGFDADEIKANPTAYKKLDGCCKA